MASPFWLHVALAGPDECWNWKAHVIAGGYGRFQVQHRRVLSHRYAWELTHGPIPDGLDVCHRCDHPRCCNPAHLFLGTHQQNMHDRNEKRRHAFGSRSGRAKLTESDVLHIRASRDDARTLATRYGVCSRSIHAVLSGQTWRHCAQATR